MVRACADDFLNPAAIRHARGRDSPEGFFLDSYDLGQARYFEACDPRARATLVLSW